MTPDLGLQSIDLVLRSASGIDEDKTVLGWSQSTCCVYSSLLTCRTRSKAAT